MIFDVGERFVKRVQEDPVFFIEEALGCKTLSWKQKEVARAVAVNPLVSVKACHDIGKTYIAARLLLWHQCSFDYSIAITTAPTARQVDDILWQEIRNAASNAKVDLGGEFLPRKSRYEIDNKWFAFGFSPEKGIKGQGQGELSSFQGYHAPHLFIIIDEATGVPAPIWIQAKGMMTSRHVRMLTIANPTSRATEFYKTFSSKVWTSLSMNCFDSPNLKVNGLNSIADLEKEIGLISSMSNKDANQRIKNYKFETEYFITAQAVIRCVLEWGLDSPEAQGKLFGEFPNDDEGVLFREEVISLSRAREPKGESQECFVGIDAARNDNTAGDKTVAIVIRGDSVETVKEFKNTSDYEVLGEAIRSFIDSTSHDGMEICVDGTGVGGPLKDKLAKFYVEHPSIKVNEVHFGSSAAGNVLHRKKKEELVARYANLKARIYDELAADLKKELSLKKISNAELYSQFPNITTESDSRDRKIILSKKDYKALYGGSPDFIDALVLANYARKIRKRQPPTVISWL